SEYETNNPPTWTLDDLVAAAFAVPEKPAGERTQNVEDANPRIWNAFRRCWNGAQLVSSETTRELPQQFDSSLVRQVTVPITDLLVSAATLREAVRAVIEADLLVLDVTGFEPGVMLLLGVRAACRRGVTVCTHGAKWREGQPLELPFNLFDLSVGSH